MDLRHLKSFSVLADELHFKRAAEKLLITQPALSFQVKQLEREMKVKLFKRSNRKVEMTPSGRAFKKRVDIFFTYLHNGVRESQLIHEGRSGYLKIGFSGFVAFDLMPRVIERFQEEYEEVQIDLKHMTTNEQEMSLIEGDIDVGFLINSSLKNQLISYTIREDKMVLAIPSKYDIDFREQYIGIESFRNHKFIMPIQSGGSGYYNKAYEICRNAGFEPDVIQEVNELHIIISLVASGLGVAIVPESIKDVMGVNVVYKYFKNCENIIPTEISYKEENDSILIQNFIGIVKEFAGRKFQV